MKKLLLILFISIIATSSYSQNINSKDTEEVYADSSDYIFPLFAKKIKESGHNVPLPTGLMINVVAQQSEILINDFQFGLSPDKLKDFSWVKFSPEISNIMAYNARMDFWVLPFLNVYANYAYSTSSNNLDLQYPLQFPISTDSYSHSSGFGFTTAYGWGKYFLAANFNFTWTDTKALSSITNSQIISVRFGRQIRLNKNWHLAPSIGMQYQHMSAYSQGHVKTEMIGVYLNNPTVQNLVGNTKDKYDSFYQNLSYPERKVVDKVSENFHDATNNMTLPSEFYYAFDKYRPHEIAGLVGLSVIYKDKHMFRIESAYGNGYLNVMATYNFHFGIINKHHHHKS